MNTHQKLTDYTSFMVPDETFPNITNCIGVVRGLIHDADNLKSGHNSLEVALLRIPDGYCCADLSLYKVSITRLSVFFFLLFFFASNSHHFS